MSFKESIKRNNPKFLLGNKGAAIETVVSCNITENGLEIILNPIAPMTCEKLIEGYENIMKALNARG